MIALQMSYRAAIEAANFEASTSQICEPPCHAGCSCARPDISMDEKWRSIGEHFFAWSPQAKFPNGRDGGTLAESDARSDGAMTRALLP